MAGKASLIRANKRKAKSLTQGQRSPPQKRLHTDNDADDIPTSDLNKVDGNKQRRLRPRLQSKDKLKEKQDDSDLDLDPYSLHKCSAFDPDRPQPFEMTVHSNALLVMDFHSHLHTNEIIGLLGGIVTQSTMTVRAAYPCRALPQDTNNGTTNVEMCPSSQEEIQRLIHDSGMEVVGWYHSHPTFEPNPSLIDIANQASYQEFCHNEDQGKTPWAGCIISPYCRSATAFASTINWFYTELDATRTHKAKALVCELHHDTAPDQHVQDAIDGLLAEYSQEPEHVSFSKAKFRRKAQEDVSSTDYPFIDVAYDTKLFKCLVSVLGHISWCDEVEPVEIDLSNFVDHKDVEINEEIRSGADMDTSKDKGETANLLPNGIVNDSNEDDAKPLINGCLARDDRSTDNISMDVVVKSENDIVALSTAIYGVADDKVSEADPHTPSTTIWYDIDDTMIDYGTVLRVKDVSMPIRSHIPNPSESPTEIAPSQFYGKGNGNRTATSSLTSFNSIPTPTPTYSAAAIQTVQKIMQQLKEWS